MISTAQALKSFQSTIAKLRSEEGCPWIKDQDHTSLARFLREETYEVLYEIRNKSFGENFCKELGDVFLQIVLHAQLAEERNAFNLKDVIESINYKMKSRNPHVFNKKKKLSIEDIHKQWENIKMNESAQSIQEKIHDKLSAYGPATLQAEKIGNQAKELNFDWGHISQVIDKLQEEVNEVKEALATGDMEHTKEELGDLYFTIAQVCRHLNFDPEDTAREGNLKFLKRFKKLQELAEKADINLKETTQPELETFWLEAKKH